MKQNQLNDNFLVLATKSLTDERTFVLKHNNTFANFNLYGDIIPFPGSSQGIFHEGTRFLSNYQMKIEGENPLFLSSNLKARNEKFIVDLTNPDIIEDHHLKLEKDIIHIKRRKTVWKSAYYEQIWLHNFGLEEVEFNIDLEFGADFSDIFEIRGTKRLKKGILLPLNSDSNSLEIKYIGLDNIKRTTRVLMKPEPDFIDNYLVNYFVSLKPGENIYIFPTLSFEISGKENPVFTFRKVTKRKGWENINIFPRFLI